MACAEKDRVVARLSLKPGEQQRQDFFAARVRRSMSVKDTSSRQRSWLTRTRSRIAHEGFLDEVTTVARSLNSMVRKSVGSRVKAGLQLGCEFIPWVPVPGEIEKILDNKYPISAQRVGGRNRLCQGALQHSK